MISVVFRRRLTAVAATASFCVPFLIAQAIVPPRQARVSVTTAPHTMLATDDHSPLFTLTPTPAPQALRTPVASLRPTRVPVLQRAGSAPVLVTATPSTRPLPAPVARRDWLTSGDGALDTAVGVYTDCSGVTELTHTSAAIDTCIPGPPYFVGHNVGVFTPLMHMGEGSIITYHDGNAMAHVWRVVSVRPDWRSVDGAPAATQPDVVAQFQTCVVPDGSIDRILDVVPA